MSSSIQSNFQYLKNWQNKYSKSIINEQIWNSLLDTISKINPSPDQYHLDISIAWKVNQAKFNAK